MFSSKSFQTFTAAKRMLIIKVRCMYWLETREKTNNYNFKTALTFDYLHVIN